MEGQGVKYPFTKHVGATKEFRPKTYLELRHGVINDQLHIALSVGAHIELTVWGFYQFCLENERKILFHEKTNNNQCMIKCHHI